MNIAETVQLAPAASEPPQVFDRPKSSAWEPVTVMELTVSEALPLLVGVTDFEADVEPDD